MASKNTLKYDVKKEWQWEAQQREKLLKLLEFPKDFINPASQAGMIQIAKQLSNTKKDAQALVAVLTAKGKSSTFKKHAPDKLQTSDLIMC